MSLERRKNVNWFKFEKGTQPL